MTTRQNHQPLVPGPNGIRQTVDVQRDEEQVIGPIPDSDGQQPQPSVAVNVDAVSEKVDVSLEDGVARITVRVRCERIVPIRGVRDMFKKSAVIVTRLIEIDMTATAERRQMYDRAVRLQAERSSGTAAAAKLSTRETFDLYKALTVIADQSSDGGEDGSSVPSGGTRQRLHIERLLEEDERRRLDPGGTLFNIDDSDELLRSSAANTAHVNWSPPSGQNLNYSSAAWSTATADATERRPSGSGFMY
jgi:hypothetical protein